MLRLNKTYCAADILDVIDTIQKYGDLSDLTGIKNNLIKKREEIILLDPDNVSIPNKRHLFEVVNQAKNASSVNSYEWEKLLQRIRQRRAGRKTKLALPMEQKQRVSLTKGANKQLVDATRRLKFSNVSDTVNFLIFCDKESQKIFSELIKYANLSEGIDRTAFVNKIMQSYKKKRLSNKKEIKLNRKSVDDKLREAVESHYYEGEDIEDDEGHDKGYDEDFDGDFVDED